MRRRSGITCSWNCSVAVGWARCSGPTTTLTDRVVALKVLPPSVVDDPVFKERFRREAHAAAGLSDPHVVPIHGYGEIDDQLYLDMRLIDGEDLGTVLTEADGPFAPERAVKVVEQVAAALDAAHAVGLVHRDVKPSNIFLADRDFVYLIDFGIARTTSQTGLTSVGSTLGTMAYMAPERFKSGLSDPRSDIYALTCVLYQCLTGHLPYTGDTLEQQLAGHLVTPTTQAVRSESFGAKGFRRRHRQGDGQGCRPALPVRAVNSPRPRRPSCATRPPVRSNGGLPTDVPRSPPNKRRRALVLAGAALALVLVVGLVAWQCAIRLVRPVIRPPLRRRRRRRVRHVEPSATDSLIPPRSRPPCPRRSGRRASWWSAPTRPTRHRSSEMTRETSGFDVDLMNAVARTLDLGSSTGRPPSRASFPRSRARCSTSGMSSFTDTKEREQVVDFVTYFQAGTQWAQRPGHAGQPEQRVRSEGRRASRSHPGRRRTSDEEQGLRGDGGAPISKIDYISQDDVTNALIDGEVDAMSADSPVTGYAVNRSAGALGDDGRRSSTRRPTDGRWRRARRWPSRCDRR